LAFFIQLFIFLLINAFEDPAFNVLHVLRVLPEAVPDITVVAFFLRAFGYFKTFHDNSPFLIRIYLIKTGLT
jgi:hypothetical protein